MDVKLLEGARSGDASQLKTLLSRPNVDDVCRSVAAGEDNVLHIAAKYGQTKYAMEVVSLVTPFTSLLYHLLLQPNCKGNTPLHCAALAARSDFVSFLVSIMDHVGIEKKNLQGNTALHLAAAGASDEDFEIVKTLVEACGMLGSDCNYSGEYPLYIAAERGSLEITKHLLKFRRFPTTLPSGKTALHAAVARNEGGVFMLLMKERPELVIEQDEDGSTPLHYVASCGDLRMTRLLLKCGDDLAAGSAKASDIEEADGGSSPHVAHICDKRGTSPIHVAAVMGHVGVIRLILESRPDSCNLFDKTDRSFLHVAVNHKSVEVVKYVLEKDDLKGMLINQQDKNGDTALHLAVRSHHLEIVRLLVKDRKLPTMVVRNSDGQTPLDLAASDMEYCHMEHRMFKIIKCLMLSGAEFSARRLDLEEKMSYSGDMNEMEKEQAARCRAIADNLTIVSVLIATVTFAAAFTLPGGYKNGTEDQNEGMAVFATRTSFGVFLISNTLAMITSMVVTYLLVQTRSFDHDIRIQSVQTSKGLMKISMASMSVAFATGTALVLPGESDWLSVVVIAMSCTVPISLYTVKTWPYWYRMMANGLNYLRRNVVNGAQILTGIDSTEMNENVGKWKPSVNFLLRRKIDRWRPNSMTSFHTPRPVVSSARRDAVIVPHALAANRQMYRGTTNLCQTPEHGIISTSAN